MNTDEQELRSLLAAKSLDIANLRSALQSANERIEKLTGCLKDANARLCEEFCVGRDGMPDDEGHTPRCESAREALKEKE